MPERGADLPSPAGGGIWWIASFPKSGNTWFRIFLANLIAGGDSPVDINALELGQIASSRPWLDTALGIDTADLTHDEVDALRPLVCDWVAAQPGGPLYCKIHDRLHDVPGVGPITGRRATAGIVYLVRNPLDVVPSLASHNGVTLDGAIATMANPDNLLSHATDRQPLQVRQKIGSWSDHVLSWVDAPGVPRVVLRYEDLLADPHAHFARAARTLGLDFTPQALDRAIAFSRFDTLARIEAEDGFRERSAHAARFFRSGQAGGWRTTLSAAQVDRVVAAHGPVMRRFGYLDAEGRPV